MSEYLDLDYCADNTLSDEQAWRGARIISGVIFDELIQHAPDRDEACFYMQDADQALCGISEQPDLTGSVNLHFARLDGLWMPNRRQDDGLYHTVPRQPYLQADFMTLTVLHQKNYQQLLTVALPMDPQSAHLLRYGRSSHYGSPSHEALNAIACHDADDAMLYPRQVRAAAWLVREVIEGKTVPVPVYSPDSMKVRAKFNGKDAQYELSQIPVFTA